MAFVTKLSSRHLSTAIARHAAIKEFVVIGNNKLDFIALKFFGENRSNLNMKRKLVSFLS